MWSEDIVDTVAECNRLEEEYDAQLRNALAVGRLLTIREFIEAVEFRLIELLPFDLMWNLRSRKVPVYLTTELLLAFGYTGELKNQKQSFSKLIKKYNIPFVKLSNDEYEQFLCRLRDTGEASVLELFPPLVRYSRDIHMKHTIVMPCDLKRLMMVVDTEGGNLLRKYFSDEETLFHMYLEYQCEFYKRCADREIREIYDLPHNREHNRLDRFRRLDVELEDRYRVGVVYFICEKDAPGIVKIGYTYSLPERLSQLQTAHYKELIVKKYYFTQFPEAAEQLLHLEHAGKHIRGEWYNFEL